VRAKEKARRGRGKRAGHEKDELRACCEEDSTDKEDATQFVQMFPLKPNIQVTRS